MKQMSIGNIRLEVERKPIKNMYLRIYEPDGRVHISAPNRMKEEEIVRFVSSRLEWIEQQQEKILRKHSKDKLMYVTGEEIELWGRKYPLILLETGSIGRVYEENDHVILQAKTGSTQEYRRKLINLWYRKALEKEIPGLIAKWENIIGVKASSWTIRDMKTRWGTCNVRTHKICLNLQLVKKPVQCLEYVVVHELVHLLEKSHNYVFKGYMDHYLPQWRRIKKELNGIETD